MKTLSNSFSIIILIIISCSNAFAYQTNTKQDNDLFESPSTEQQILPNSDNLTPVVNPFENYNPNSGDSYADKALKNLESQLGSRTIYDMLQPTTKSSSSVISQNVKNNFLIENSDKGYSKLVFVIVLGIICLFLFFKILPKLLNSIGEINLSKNRITKSEAISILKEKKDLLDLGVISTTEYEQAKNTLSQYLVK